MKLTCAAYTVQFLCAPCSKHTVLKVETAYLNTKVTNLTCFVSYVFTGQTEVIQDCASRMLVWECDQEWPGIDYTATATVGMTHLCREWSLLPC